MDLAGRIASAVGITLLLIFALIPNLPQESDVVPKWQYDDYRPLEDFPGLTSVSGSLETVTVGELEYVHAKSLGPGNIVYGSRVEVVNVEKAVLDVIFLYGQSNAAYRNAEPSLVDVDPLPGRTYYFGMDNRYAANASENDHGMDYTECTWYDMINLDTGVWRIGDKAPALAHYYNDITGHKVYIVDGAIGNKGISNFLPPSALVWTYGNNVLTLGLDHINDQVYDYSIKYYVWLQGEANSTSSVSSYVNAFLKMHNALLSGEMADVHFEKCYISLLPEKWTNSRKAQLELAEKYPDTVEIATEIANTFTVENGLLNEDDTHYTQLGNNILGKAIGIYIADEEEKEDVPLYVILLRFTPVLIGLLLIKMLLLPKR